MATKELHSWTRRVSEPPRDGEFGLQAEMSSEESMAGFSERAGRRLSTVTVKIWELILRYPVFSACLAIGTGVVITSLLMDFPPAS